MLNTNKIKTIEIEKRKYKKIKEYENHILFRNPEGRKESFTKSELFVRLNDKTLKILS